MQQRPTANHVVQTAEAAGSTPERPLRFLSTRHVRAIEDALEAVGLYGEVRLIKHAGRLRFIQKVVSESFSNEGT